MSSKSGRAREVRSVCARYDLCLVLVAILPAASTCHIFLRESFEALVRLRKAQKQAFTVSSNGSLCILAMTFFG